MPYALNSGENLLFKFGLINLPTGAVWKGLYDVTVSYVVGDAVLGTDNNGYICILANGPPTPHAPPNATYWTLLTTIPAAQVTGVTAELVDAAGTTVVSYIYSRGARLTSGLLIIGNRYIITAFVTGDDFTNVGAASNATGIVFIATGATPTTWTHSSTLQQMTLQANMVLTDGQLLVELLAGDTRPLNGDYELRVTISIADSLYVQSGSQTDVLCLPEALTITPC